MKPLISQIGSRLITLVRFLLVIFISAACGGGASVTPCGSSKPATLTTAAITNLSANTATSGGTVTDNGSGMQPFERGICWGTQSNPKLTDSNSLKDIGTGLGSFTLSMTGLKANTTYYVRSYASIFCAPLGYGNEISFVTPP
jgi:hypothetical protein